MKITKTIVTTIERTIKKHMGYNVYVDTTNDDQPEYVNDLAVWLNPLEDIDAFYWFPYNWNDTAKSKNDPQVKLISLTVNALNRADRNERKQFYNTIISPMIDKGYIDKEVFESMTIAEIIDEYAGEFSLLTHLDELEPLISKYTNYSLYPVYVYTHSDSTFRLCDNFYNNKGSDENAAFIIVNNNDFDPDPKVRKETVSGIIDNYTDYFNGSVFEFKSYSTLEDAINDNNIETLTVYANELNDFMKQLQDIE